MSPSTRRVTACYRTATPLQIEKGDAWYRDAHAIARNQATEHGVTIEVASGVLSALSPRQNWGKNVLLAERMLTSGGTLDRGCLGRSLAHARAIHAGTPVLDVLRGPKTRAFYQAILTAGESTDPVIDTHAWAMLIGQRGAEPPTNKQYREGAAVMTAAARRLGQPVHHVQAVTWLAWRSRFWTDGVWDHKPQPILEGATSW